MQKGVKMKIYSQKLRFDLNKLLKNICNYLLIFSSQAVNSCSCFIA